MKTHFDQIAPLMERSGINKRKLAEIAGVGTSAVTKWVQGGAIRIAQLKKIADYFGVDVSELSPTENSPQVNESEIRTAEYWRERALLAESKLQAVKKALTHTLDGFKELQEAVK